MAISSTTRKAGPYSCNGATVAFPFSFKVFTTADVRVVLTDALAVESDLALGANYTVAINSDQDANPGGTVTTTATYATGYKITLTSQVKNLQPVTLTNQGGFYPKVINDALDRLTIMAQQLAEQVGRAVKTSISSSSTPDQLLSDIGAAVTNASNSATAAAGSATASAGSATNSANSATASASSATAAANSATQAANSAAAVGFNLTSVSTFQNKTLQASGGNSVEATSGPNSSALAFRNKIINGACRVAQRGGVASVNSSPTYGGADRIYVYPVGFSTSSGTIQQSYGAGLSKSGYTQSVGITTTGAGTLVFGTRLEAKDVAHLSGKTVTISGVVTHNVAGANYAITGQILKANSTDNFGASSSLTTTGTLATAATGITTPFSFSYTLGASDAANGLEIRVAFNGVGAVTANSFYIGDFQLVEGQIATPMEIPPFGYDLALCQRYYEKSYDIGTPPATSTQAGVARLSYGAAASGVFGVAEFKVSKRSSPTVNTWDEAGNAGRMSFYNAGSFSLTNNLNALASNWGGVSRWGFSASTSTAGAAGTYTVHWAADAEL